jgi:asparagine synthase (glutamine-hydrolysing)
MDGLFGAARRESLISWSLTCRVAGWHCFGVCGIAGFTTFSASHYDPDQIIRRMTQVIRHRGPDGEGYYRDATVTFGHRRLAIIDLGGGAQPMADDSDRYSLVYNGEVYNYIELRRELEQQGQRFRTHFFASIRKVEPGAWLKFDANGLSQGFYWDIPLTDNPVGPGRIEECCEELLQLMRNSVRRQLRSDVPVGVFLSGGIDSSAITALAAQESSGRLHSFSIGFDQAGYDESPHARRVASLFGTEHHEEIMTLQQAADFFPRVIQSLDEPFADASALPTSLLCQFAAKSVKVVLGGDGGDELFAGYPSFQAHKVVEALSFLPVGWRDWLGHLVRRLPFSHHYTSVEYMMQQFLKGLGLPPEVRFLLWMGCYGNAEKQQLFSTDFRQQLAGGDPFEDVARYVRRSGLIGDFERLQYLCLKLYFQDDILVKMDRSSMAHSLEVRVPFMDRDLMEYACRIQPFNKLRGMQTKYVLKRALHGLLPDDIIHRRKAGFMMPVARWLSGEMRETVEDLCSPGAVSRAGLFDAAFVRQILDEHFQRRRDHRKHIYPLVCFMAWLRNQGTA